MEPLRVHLPEAHHVASEPVDKHVKHNGQPTSSNKPQKTVFPKQTSFENRNYSPSPVVTPRGTPCNTDDELDSEEQGKKEKDAVSSLKNTSGMGAQRALFKRSCVGWLGGHPRGQYLWWHADCVAWLGNLISGFNLTIGAFKIGALGQTQPCRISMKLSHDT